MFLFSLLLLQCELNINLMSLLRFSYLKWLHHSLSAYTGDNLLAKARNGRQPMVEPLPYLQSQKPRMP